MVHEPNRNKESHSLLRIESLPISTFIRGRFGLKHPVKFTEQGVYWLLAASRFQPGKNAWSLAVGPSRPAGTRGQHMRWWVRPQQLGWGAISDPASQFGGSSHLLLSARLPGCYPQCSARPQLQGQVRLEGSCGRRAGPCPRQRPGHSQAQLSHQPSQSSSLHCLRRPRTRCSGAPRP